jgi:AcrR family transcriptional regulator
MPTRFQAGEKAEIRRTLLQKGEELFTKYGLKKTTIDDITRASGIAKGSFYSFFPSKEALYFQVLEYLEGSLQKRVLENSAVSGENPQKLLRNLIISGFGMIEEYPLLRELFDPSVYQQLIRKLPRKTVEIHKKNDEERLIPLIKEMQRKSGMIQKDPKIIAGLLRAVFIMVLHKKEVGEELFPEIIELLAESLSRGLFE